MNELLRQIKKASFKKTTAAACSLILLHSLALPVSAQFREMEITQPDSPAAVVEIVPQGDVLAFNGLYDSSLLNISGFLSRVGGFMPWIGDQGRAQLPGMDAVRLQAMSLPTLAVAPGLAPAHALTVRHASVVASRAFAVPALAERPGLRVRLLQFLQSLMSVHDAEDSAAQKAPRSERSPGWGRFFDQKGQSPEGDPSAPPSEGEESVLSSLGGQEVHLRLRSNHLLENGRSSLTAIAQGTGRSTVVIDPVFESKEYTAYSPTPVAAKIIRRLRNGKVSGDARASVVFVEEHNGSLSPDDARYIEWLAQEKGAAPRVLMLPEEDHHVNDAQPAADSLDANNRTIRAASFWKRQLRRLRTLPAPITKDAALAAIPRTVIPIGISLGLAYLNRHTIPMERSAGYIGWAFSLAVGFALFNQTVLNYVTFCSELTRDLLDSPIRALGRFLSVHTRSHPLISAFLGILRFMSARGDVLIAGPSIGILCTYLSRLILGPVGETVSVLTWLGFFQVVCNVIVGSFAGGPYNETIAHLRAVGKISNRAAMYLGVVETIKMEFGRLADFGMQALFNAIQGTLAVGFWLALLVVDRCYPKPDVQRLKNSDDIAAVKSLFSVLRAKADAAKGGTKLD